MDVLSHVDFIVNGLKSVESIELVNRDKHGLLYVCVQNLVVTSAHVTAWCPPYVITAFTALFTSGIP